MNHSRYSSLADVTCQCNILSKPQRLLYSYIWDQKLLLIFGVLIAWAVLSYVFLPITLWLETRRTKENVQKNRVEVRQRVVQDEEKNA